MVYVNDEFVSYLFEGMYLSLTIFITEEMIFREGFFIILKNAFKRNTQSKNTHSDFGRDRSDSNSSSSSHSSSSRSGGFSGGGGSFGGGGASGSW